MPSVEIVDGFTKLERRFGRQDVIRVLEEAGRALNGEPTTERGDEIGVRDLVFHVNVRERACILRTFSVDKRAGFN